MNDSAISSAQKTARTVGQTLATVQHLIDLGVSWGFRKLKNVEGTEEVRTMKNAKCLQKPLRIARSVVAFIGRTGDAYYEWYGKLKRGK